MSADSGRLRLGVDFGTTRTVVSVCDRGNYPIVSFVGPGGESLDWYPSLLALRDGELRAGLEALHVAEDPSFEHVRSLKRRVARRDDARARAAGLGGATADAAGLLTEFLRALLTDLRTRSNIARRAARATRIEAMVAAPANAHGAQRLFTLDAFRAAGFHVVGMLNEPSAAAFEYAHRYRDTLTSRREQVAVYDLGGGTFDASLLQMSGRSHEVLRAQGIGRLGGDDFDRVLAELALAQAGISPAGLSEAETHRLLEHCRELKERLHPSSRRISVDVESCLDPEAPRPEPVVISVNDYYEAVGPLIEQTLDVLLEVLPGLEARGAAEESLESTAPDRPHFPEGVAGVYVVGGASALPAVARALREKLGRRVHRSPYPSAAVAIGLAIALDAHAGYSLEDRFSRVLGVFREADAGAEVTFDPLLGAEVALPVSGAVEVLEREYQAAHNVGHFRFVECSRIDSKGQPGGEVTPCADVLFPFDPALRSADADLARVPVTRAAGPGPRIRERYLVDAAGLVELTITDLDTGYERRVRLSA